MKVKDLNGVVGNWSLTGCSAHSKLENKSSYHLQAREILKKLFPTLQILEEVPISPRKSETQYLDFYIPLKKMCVEVHGEQHTKFTAFYHSTIWDFVKAQKKDKDKQDWCSLNGISYISLNYDEDTSIWETKLLK
jgi:hypothetical protein